VVPSSASLRSRAPRRKNDNQHMTPLAAGTEEPSPARHLFTRSDLHNIGCGGDTSISQQAVEALIEQVLRDHPQQVEQFRGGRHKVLGFLVGQVMKASGGRADPKRVNALMREKLGG